MNTFHKEDLQMKARQFVFLLSVLCLLALPIAAQEAPPPPQQPQEPEPAPVTVPTVYYDKIAVKVDGKADVNGVIKLEFKAHGGEPKLISVNVIAKMGAKDIARDLWKELSLAAGAQYKVKQNDKVIKIGKANKKGPPFTLSVIGQSVKGLSVSIK